MDSYSITSRYENLDTCLDDYRSWYEWNQTRVVDLPSCVQFLHLASDGRLFLFHLLRNEIMSLRTQFMDSSQLDQALDKFTQNYIFNTKTITDMIPLVKFLKEAQDDSLTILHLLRDQLRTAQEKPVTESVLWLPESLS
jgi:hypothetical protein